MTRQKCGTVTQVLIVQFRLIEISLSQAVRALLLAKGRADGYGETYTCFRN
jgi:hypothetical protein